MSEERTGAPGSEPLPPADDLDADEPDFLEPDEPDDGADDAPEADDVEPQEREDEPLETRRTERRPGRAAQRIETITHENAELRNRIAAIEGRQQMPDPRAAAEAARAEEAAFRESLRNMLPDEAALAVAERSERKMQAQIFQARIEGFDAADRGTFETLKQTMPAASRLADRVEQLLQQRRQQGDFTLGRRDILAFLIGQDALAKAGRTTQQQRQQGARRIARETTRPASGRGSESAAPGARRGTQDDADERILRGTNAHDTTSF